MKTASPLILTLALAATTALAVPPSSDVPFTAGNFVVLRCDGYPTTGAVGHLDEYTPSGTLVQTIDLPQDGLVDDVNGIVFDGTAIGNDMSMTADRAYVVLSAYGAMSSGSVSATGNHVISLVKYDGSYSRPVIITTSTSTQFRSGAASGFGQYYTIHGTSGTFYEGLIPPTTANLGSTARCLGVFNGNLYETTSAGIQQWTGFPTSGGPVASVWVKASQAPAGFAIPPTPFVSGSKAYIGNYTQSTITRFTYNGSTWDTGVNFATPASPQHLAVDYSGANPVLYFTCATSANGVYTVTDTGGSPSSTLIVPYGGTGVSGEQYRGIAVVPQKPALPAFTTQPVPQTVVIGGTADFGTVVATGANPNAWTWMRGNTVLADVATASGSIISGSTTAHLTIANVGPADAGVYYAVAANNGGTTLSDGTSTLTISGSCITAGPANATVVAGVTATFTVNATACTPTATYAWYYQNTPLSEGTGPSGSSTISGSGMATLQVANPQALDAGNYTVVVTDGASAQSAASATLTVISVPVITSEPVNVFALQGQSVSFRVAAAGGGTLTYRWYKHPSSGPDVLLYPDSANRTGTGTPILAIANAQDADQGSYFVRVSNAAGTTDSSPYATLTVGIAPVITTAPGTLQLASGDTGTFTVAATGSPTLTYTWVHSGSTVGSGTSLAVTPSNPDSDKGLYTVTVQNTYGSAVASGILNFIVPPPSCQLNPPPNQILMESFNYEVSESQPWSPLYVQTITNQLTGVGLTWNQVGNNDWRIRNGPMLCYAGPSPGTLTDPPVPGGRPLVTDEYPVLGLAGNSPNLAYVTTDVNGGQENLHFGTGGDISSGTVYFSAVVQLGSFQAPSSTVWTDYLCGLGTGNSSSTTHTLGLYITEPQPANTWPNVGYTVGVFKGDLATGALNPGVNGDWAPGRPDVSPYSHTAFLDYDILFVVCRLNINAAGPGYSTCDLWVNPTPSSFHTNEANLPIPTVANVGGTVADTPGSVSLFWMKATTYPVSRNITDLRVGKTWASVTPPAAPTFVGLTNIALGPTDTTAVFASQNVGNPVDTSCSGGYGYTWTFTALGGSPITLSADGPGPSGSSTISGTATGTLTINNPVQGDVGTYTVTGSSVSPATSDNGATLTGSASASLTIGPPLSIAYSDPYVILSWPDIWTGFTLQETLSLNPVSWGTSPATISDAGGKFGAAVAPSGMKFYRLKK